MPPPQYMFYPPPVQNIPQPKSTAQKLLEDFDKDAAPVIDMDHIMDKLDTQIDALRKDLFGRFATTKQFETLEHHVTGKLDEMQRQTDVCKDDLFNTKNAISGHNWDINELKTQVYELKSTVAEALSKLNTLQDDFYSRTYDIDIDALYKKMQSLERDVREKVDCEIFDKELIGVKQMALQAV